MIRVKSQDETKHEQRFWGSNRVNSVLLLFIECSSITGPHQGNGACTITRNSDLFFAQIVRST